MKKIIIYTTDNCPYCHNAKNLLDRKGVEYNEVRLDKRPELVYEKSSHSNNKRV